MGMEVAASGLPQVNGKVDVSEPIKFGSHGTNENPQVEANNVSQDNTPKDAVDDWKIHQFWFVKYRSYDDPNLKGKIDQTDKEIQKLNQQRSQILDDLRAKRSQRSELIAELKSLGAESSQYWAVINEKRQEMKPLQDALGTLRGAGREKGVGICSSEEELNAVIQSLEYQIQHESLTLKEEKQILREIKELEATRPKVVANTAVRAKIQDSLGQKDAIQDQVKLLGTDLDGVRKQKAVIKAKMDHLSEQVKALDDQIQALQGGLESVSEKRDKAFETIQQLRKKRDDGNAHFYQNRTILNGARELAAKKGVKALEDLVHAEVEKFMSNWNTNKAFRDDYQKRILTSLDMRQLSRDGRMRNPDEKPLVMSEAPRSSQPDAVPKATVKLQKEDPKTNATKEENLAPKKAAQKEARKKSTEPELAMEEEDNDVFVVEKPKKDEEKNDEVDESTLKEMKKEEEKEKQRQALERKKKLQEKAAAKAALRAQKETEKKQKEREKKLKKKEGTSAQPTTEEEVTEKEADVVEPEKSEDAEEAIETPAPPKAKQPKEKNALRFRNTAKTRGGLPKAILKKKKSANYWVWAYVAAAVVVVMILVALGYKYLL